MIGFAIVAKPGFSVRKKVASNATNRKAIQRYIAMKHINYSYSNYGAVSFNFQDAPDDGGRSGGGNKRPDWICDNCQARVYGSKSSCFKCNEAKGESKVQFYSFRNETIYKFCKLYFQS